ncbi:MAG: GGDEF domain-containing protein [Myxococcales bacterium]|nr:GGDEF domain-containing protein [Myxococcales bacterium]
MGDPSSNTVVMKPLAPSAKQEEQQAILLHIHPPGPDLGRRYPLLQAEYVIGRTPELDIYIDSDSVSRRHARVYVTHDGWHVEDLDSTNGSFVNDVKVKNELLRPGDYLRLGDVIYKFLFGSDVEAAYHEEIYRMTILDGLTGVHNKRYFLEFLDRELARAMRYGTALSLVLFDIDYFKRVNDTHGHLAGDAVLKELCRRLKPRIRREDLLARYGGEEFACVLSNTDKRGALNFAESVRRMMEQQPFAHEELSMKVTVSLGVACRLGEDKAEATEFIRQADECLYQAKRSGRNRVVG